MRPIPFPFPHFRLLLAGFLMVSAFGVLVGGAAAQDEPPPESASVATWVRLCLEPGCTELLEATEPVDGVTVTITDTQTGDTLGTCVTGDLEPGACQVDIGTAESVSIALDASGFPDGYEATENPGQLDLVNGSEYQFLLFPVGGFPDDDAPEDPPASDDDDSQADISELPSTGAGVANGQYADRAPAAPVLLLAMMLGLAAAGVRALVGNRQISSGRALWSTLEPPSPVGDGGSACAS
jgi:hypothetical protein